MEFFTSKIVTAKRQHTCEACGTTIAIGEKYRKETGKWEGDFFSRAWCSDCSNIMDYYFDFLTTECEFDYWEVQDNICEKFCYPCKHGMENDDDCPQEYDFWHCPSIQQQIKQAYASKQTIIREGG